jgi:hypothetical protein
MCSEGMGVCLNSLRRIREADEACEVGYACPDHVTDCFAGKVPVAFEP